MVLDVASCNPLVPDLYERLGFAIADERHSTLFNARGIVLRRTDGWN